MPNKNGKQFLDITSDVCPMTFVRTKLAMEKLEKGDTLTIRLKGEEPLNNVPRNAQNHGYGVVSLEPDDEAGVYVLVLQRLA